MSTTSYTINFPGILRKNQTICAEGDIVTEKELLMGKETFLRRIEQKWLIPIVEAEAETPPEPEPQVILQPPPSLEPEPKVEATPEEEVEPGPGPEYQLMDSATIIYTQEEKDAFWDAAEVAGARSRFCPVCHSKHSGKDSLIECDHITAE